LRRQGELTQKLTSFCEDSLQHIHPARLLIPRTIPFVG
jgi:hypothetical protein